MKEVGIMTWFTYNNYGTVLQAYALSKKTCKLFRKLLITDLR